MGTATSGLRLEIFRRGKVVRPNRRHHFRRAHDDRGRSAACGEPPPVCIAVHGLFADHSDELLVAAGARFVTTNSVGSGRNDIDIGPLLGEAIQDLETVQPRL